MKTLSLDAIKLLTIAFVLMLPACTRSAPPAEVKHYSLNKDNPGSLGVIQVYEGDTLYNISKRYQIPLRDIIDENNLSAPYNIDVGQRLAMPSPRTYEVKHNDSYASIARMHNLSVTELVQINNARAPYLINKGDQIVLSKSKGFYVADNKKPSTTIKPAKKVLTAQQRKDVKSVVKLSKPPARSGGAFDWPIQGRVISNYGAKKGGLFNDGLNIAAPRGTAIRVSENGVVAYAGDDLKGFGNLVLVKHDGGYVTAYAHMEKMLTKKGQIVSRGETIGTVGSTGSVDSPQLHFEVRKNGKAINPKQYLSGS